jgi:4-hydroxybenzoate polyprenyltransferase
VEDPTDRPPKDRIDEFLFGREGAPGLGAIWWGGGGLIALLAAVFTLLDGKWWWSIFMVPLAAWQFWEMKKAIRRRSF